jgi:hypothetical protein
MNEFSRDVASAKTFNELEGIVSKVIGTSGLMEFMRLYLGEIQRKEGGPKSPKALRLIGGNPQIMKQMLEQASSNARHGLLNKCKKKRRRESCPHSM